MMAKIVTVLGKKNKKTEKVKYAPGYGTDRFLLRAVFAATAQKKEAQVIHDELPGLLGLLSKRVTCSI